MTAKPAGQMPELLPCPFCGEQTAEISEHDYANQGGCGIVYGIICDCGATAGSNYMKKEYAIEAWNRRALPAEWEQRKAAAPEAANVPEGYTVEEVAAGQQSLRPYGLIPEPAPEPAGGMPEEPQTRLYAPEKHTNKWYFWIKEIEHDALRAHAEQLQARVKEVEHERDTHYTRLGGLLFFGALDAKTVAECRLWAHEYSDWKKRAGQLQERVRELERLVYVPGLLKCAKCKLVLVTTNLHVNTGQVSANNEPQKCPNGCGPMWRLTERDSGNDLCDRLEQAEARLREARKLMIGWKEDDSSGHYDRLRDIDAALAAQGGDKEGEE